MTRATRKRGFTLVELLVVILIIATLMAVALPLYLSAVEDSAKKTCRANMHGIANAAAAWVTRTETSYSLLTLSELSEDIGSVPICPDGGTYTLVFTGSLPDSRGDMDAIPVGGIGISCSFPGHNAFIPGMMAD